MNFTVLEPPAKVFFVKFGLSCDVPNFGEVHVHSRWSTSVCKYRASCYIPHLYVESRVPLGFLCCSQRIYCVDFIENALFKSSGEIC